MTRKTTNGTLLVASVVIDASDAYARLYVEEDELGVGGPSFGMYIYIKRVEKVIVGNRVGTGLT